MHHKPFHSLSLSRISLSHTTLELFQCTQFSARENPTEEQGGKSVQFSGSHQLQPKSVRELLPKRKYQPNGRMSSSSNPINLEKLTQICYSAHFFFFCLLLDQDRLWESAKQKKNSLSLLKPSTFRSVVRDENLIRRRLVAGNLFFSSGGWGEGVNATVV